MRYLCPRECAPSVGIVSGYEAGRRVEWAVVHHLTDNGYECTRAASSKGVCDVVGFKPGQVAFVSVKRTTMPGPGERADLLRVAAMIPGSLALVALKPLRRPLEFRRLTGPGPRDWEPWTCDEVGA